MRSLLCLSLLSFALLERAACAPTLTNDSYTTDEDVPLTVPAPGVLGNDTPEVPGGTMNAGVATQPQHGAVVMNTDGSFTYTPAGNYSGPDSFTYSVLSPRVFTVDQARSKLTVNVAVDARATIAGAQGSDSDTGAVNGSGLIFISPPNAPGAGATVQVQSLDLNLAEGLDFDICLVRFIGCLAGIQGSIVANGLQINMTQPGPATVVSGTSTFTQPRNLFSSTGIASLTTSGGVPAGTVPESVSLSSTDQPYDITNASIGLTNGGTTIEVRTSLDITQQLVDPGYTVTIRLTGDIYATAPVNPSPPVTTATVSLNVNTVDDAPSAVNDRYYSRQNYLLNIPATATQTTEALIPVRSAWKWNAGTDLGTAWRAPEYNDAAWAAGAGILGFGDTDITTTVTARPNPAVVANATTNPNYPTTYFRREFTLTDPFDTLVPTIGLMRDDAAIVYMNGTEVFRDSTPYTTGGAAPLAASPAVIPYSTYAAVAIPDATTPTPDDEKSYRSITFSRSLLREGRNVIAVEVHNQSATSSDLRFDLQLSRTRGVGGLLANDSDPDGPAMNTALQVPPANGTVVVNPDGSFTYTPAPGFTGTDSFLYRITDTSGGITPVESRLVARGATWKYLANGTAAPQDAGITAADWRNAAFTDTAWLSGAAEFGYGDGDEATVIEDDATAGSPTAGSTTRYITSYFRHKFTPSVDPGLIQALQLNVVRDDGVAVYLNGTRILLDNLPEGATSTTPALVAIGGADETTPVAVSVPLNLLRSGENILTAEIHQSAADSSDVSFSAELVAFTVPGARAEIVVLDDDVDNDLMSDTWERANGIDAGVVNATADNDRDGMSNRAEFLAGTDPNSPASVLALREVTPQPDGTLQLQIQSAPGRLYQLQRSTTLGGWTNTGSPFNSAAAGTTTLRLTPAVTPGAGFYRIALLNDWQ